MGKHRSDLPQRAALGAGLCWFFVRDSILDPGGRPLSVYFTGGGVRSNTLTLR